MTRRVLNLLTALSLVLCVAVVALWVRSYYYWDHYYQAGPDGDFGVTSNWGGVAVRLSKVTDQSQWPVKASVVHRSGQRRTWEMGVGVPAHADELPEGWALNWRGEDLLVAQFGSREGADGLSVYIRHWLLAIPFYVLPCIWLARRGRLWRGRRRKSAGLCPRCGYDLTGNVSGVCPECGSRAGGR